MKWAIVQLSILGMVAGMVWPRGYRATAKPETDLEITMSIWPMQSFHSDWHRKVSFEHRGARIAMRLFEGTGWWKGSNLYIHNSGTYVVHEGQNGCFAFTIEPTEFVSVPRGVCTRHNLVERNAESGSIFYRDLIYLGHFQETIRDPEDIKIRFFTAGQKPEVDLPEML